jgi:hypothetical protein
MKKPIKAVGEPHESARPDRLARTAGARCRRRRDEASLDEVERIVI